MSLDGSELPFINTPGYADQVDCAKACENSMNFNGCSTSKCFCSPQNFAPGSQQYMASCVPEVCSASQTASIETAALAIFSAYCTSKGYTDLAQVTVATSKSVLVSVSTSSMTVALTPTPSLSASSASSPSPSAATPSSTSSTTTLTSTVSTSSSSHRSSTSSSTITTSVISSSTTATGASSTPTSNQASRKGLSKGKKLAIGVVIPLFIAKAFIMT